MLGWRRTKKESDVLKLVFNPLTAFAAAAGVFFGLRGWVGYPANGLDAGLFILLFAVGCHALFLPWFLASPSFRRLKAAKFPDDDPIAYYAMSVPSAFMHATMLCAIALILGADHAFMTRLGCAALALLLAASTAPLCFPSVEADVRERIEAIVANFRGGAS